MQELNRKQKALLAAVRQKRVDTVRDILRDKRFDPNFPSWTHGTTPLHEAVKAGNLTILKLLVAAGADVSCTTKDGSTPQGLAERIGAKDGILTYLKSEGRRLADPAYRPPRRKGVSKSFNQQGKKPAFDLQTLPDVFEPSKWVGKVEEMQKLWEGVPKRLKEKFDFAAALSDARQKTLKKNPPQRAILKKKDPPAPPPRA